MSIYGLAGSPNDRKTHQRAVDEQIKRFDAESPAGTSLVSTPVEATPVVSTNDVDSGNKRTCTRPTCRAEMRPGLRCKNPDCGLA